MGINPRRTGHWFLGCFDIYLMVTNKTQCDEGEKALVSFFIASRHAIKVFQSSKESLNDILASVTHFVVSAPGEFPDVMGMTGLATCPANLPTHFSRLSCHMEQFWVAGQDDPCRNHHAGNATPNHAFSRRLENV